MDLSTRYLGLALRNPIIASASPLSGDVGVIRQMEDSGAGAVVLPSLFEEQIEQEARVAYELTRVGADSSPEASSYFPAAVACNSGPHGYLDLVARARAAVDIPVIASLNGTTVAGWVDYAGLIEQAGATAIELNFYRIASGATVIRRRGRGGLRGASQGGTRPSYTSRRRQIAPSFFSFRRVGPATRWRRGGWAGAVQPPLSTRYRSRSSFMDQRSRAQQSRRDPAWAPLAHPSIQAAAARFARGGHGRRDRRRSDQISARRRRRSDDRFSFAPAWTRASAIPGRRTGELVGCARLCFGDRHQRLDAGIASRSRGGVQTSVATTSRVY